MVTRQKERAAPDLDREALTEDFQEQLAAGHAQDAIAVNTVLPPLLSPRGQSLRMDRCIWRNVTLSDTKAQSSRIRDTLIEDSDLANIDLTGSLFERVEICATRLTGAVCGGTQFKSVLFRECKLDLLSMR